jgi:hypothetical protein
MGLLRRARARVALLSLGGEAFLQLSCASCGHVVQRRIAGRELEEWVLRPKRRNQQCPECGLESATVRLIKESEFRKRYPHPMRGG